MSSLQIPAWTPEDIANWIRGLDNDLQQYIPIFLEHQVSGDRLLKMTKQGLEDLGITKMGHKELMLEAIDLLSVVHYVHPSETLQSVALNLNCKASNLANLLNQRLRSGNRPTDCQPSTILLRVSETISAAKTLISWLDRPPFSNGPERDFQEFSKDLLHYALEMTQAVQANTDLTAALPEIMAIAREFASIADNLIKQSTDPLVIQPTTIEEVRIKKKRAEEELGLFIKTSTIDGIHTITGTKDQSAASLSRKIGPGDELLRVNEQTVISWEHSKVVTALRSDPMGVSLTLRKRPCNLGSPGQILRPGNSPYSMRLGGTPKLARKDSFPSMKSPLMKEEFLMPMSPNDLLISKQRSNSDPETQSETHVAHSDSEALVQEAERIKRQRRGTMAEGLQRKGSKSQTTEGRPRSLPINTEELEAEVAMLKASPISSRPAFSPIAGSPVSPVTGSSAQSSPLPNGAKTPSRTVNSPEVAADSAAPKKVTTFQADISSPSKVTAAVSITTIMLSKPELEISKPAEDEECKQEPAEDEKVKDAPKPEPKSPGSTDSKPSTPEKPISEPVEAKNTNNNVEASSEEAGQQEVRSGPSEIVVSDKDEFVVVDVVPPSPSKFVSFVERPESVVSDTSATCGVKLRPKKTKSKRKYKVTRGVSCVDLGPGECQGWLHKKSETKQTFRSNWMEMWFVLKDFVLYYYKSKSDTKAKGVICLPGYIVSEAPESKRENAFKAVHQGTKPIYFAAQRRNDMQKWMEKLGLAAIMYTDRNRVRQSIIFESQPSVDVDAMMQSVDGYHSESDDDEKEKRPSQSGPLSPASSDKSDESSSEAVLPKTETNFRRSHTAPDLLNHHDETDAAISSALIKSSETLRSPEASASNARPNAGPTVEGAAVQQDALLDHYMSLMVNNGCVSGLERTKEARTSKRFKQKGAGLTRIQTILDKNPQKNKKALQKRALQRTLKAKQEELLQIESLLSSTSLSSESLNEWRASHEDILEHILKEPKPEGVRDSDSETDVSLSSQEEPAGVSTGTSQPPVGGSSASNEAPSGDSQPRADVHPPEAASNQTSPASPSSPVQKESATTPSPVLDSIKVRSRAESEASESSL